MKAMLYDKLVKGEMVSEQDKTFLVDFKQKSSESTIISSQENQKPEKVDSDPDLEKYDSEADDDW